MIYLDNASTTKTDDRLRPIICDYMFSHYGNANSPHSLGEISKTALETAREKVACSLNASKNAIIFTSCGSEANTLAIVGLVNHLKKLHLNHIITTKYEHHSVLNAMQEMERRGFDVTYLDVKGGVIDYGKLIRSVRNDTGLISIMYVNNEIGSINDVEKIYWFCKEREILFHTDCVQAYGTLKINMDKTADMVSISGHKVHAPKGVGCLCAKHREFLSPIICGGEQEFGIRPGTENIANIAALGEIAATMVKNIDADNLHIQQLSNAFCSLLAKRCKDYEIEYRLNARDCPRTPKILSICFPDIDAETMKMMLDTSGVCISSSSACMSHSMTASHVLKAIGLSDNDAKSTIRVSFSMLNTMKEIIDAVDIIVKVVWNLKNLNRAILTTGD